MAGTPTDDKIKRRVFSELGAGYINNSETVLLIDIQKEVAPEPASQLLVEGTIEAINGYSRQYRNRGYNVKYGSMCTDINTVGDGKRIWITAVVKLKKDKEKK